MTNQQLRKKTEGFTIIEVLIVLAIAGLIMLIVFLAVPALRRNQQNNQMRSEASRVLTGATEFESNANGTQVSSTTIASVYNAAMSATPAASRQLTPATTFNNTAGINADGRSSLVVGTCVGTTATPSAGRTYAIEFRLRGGQHACLQS
jgi:prepilin-type N-terminal cleavage/methylation domain-containing protein